MNKEQIEHDAASWLAVLDKDNLIEQENIDLNFLAERNKGFKNWVEQSDYHRVAFLQLIYVWQHEALEHAYEPKVVKVTAKRTVFLAMAATVLLMVMPMMQLFETQNQHMYETRVGVRETVALNDGSLVELNSNSKMTSVITEEERVVTLTKGEAFFDIAHKEGQPFRVITGEQVITVLGTKFSVHKVGDDVKVVVTEGKVQVDHLTKSANSEFAVLTAGNIAETSEDEIIVSKQSVEEVNKELSWRHGIIIFDGTTLEDAVSEFNRYNKVQLSFIDSDVSQLKISGQFESQNYDAFLRLISEGYGLKISRSKITDTIEISG